MREHKREQEDISNSESDTIEKVPKIKIEVDSFATVSSTTYAPADQNLADDVYEKNLKQFEKFLVSELLSISNKKDMDLTRLDVAAYMFRQLRNILWNREIESGIGTSSVTVPADFEMVQHSVKHAIPDVKNTKLFAKHMTAELRRIRCPNNRERLRLNVIKYLQYLKEKLINENDIDSDFAALKSILMAGKKNENDID